MIKLDYLTIAVILSLMCLIITIIFTILNAINRIEKGIEMLALSAAISFLGFLSAFFDPIIGNSQIFLGNVGSLTSSFFLLEGILRFKNYKKSTLKMRYFLPALSLIILTSFINKDNVTNRFLIHDLVIAAILFTIAFLFIKGTKGNERKISRILSYAFIFEGLCFLYRWFLAANGYFESGDIYYPFMGLFLLITMAWLMIYILSILLIISYRAQLRITQLASTDSLTGLPNRRSLNENLQLLIDNLKTGEEEYILFLIDLNGFKKINDNYGHAFGDLILQKMSEKIKNTIREKDLSGRLGGDEFIVVLRLHRNSDIIPMMERLRNYIEKPMLVDSYYVELKISIGYSLLADKNINLDDLMNKADMMMYNEKTLDREMTIVSETEYSEI